MCITYKCTYTEVTFHGALIKYKVPKCSVLWAKEDRTLGRRLVGYREGNIRPIT